MMKNKLESYVVIGFQQSFIQSRVFDNDYLPMLNKYTILEKSTDV